MIYAYLRKQRFSTTVVIRITSATGAMQIDILRAQGILQPTDVTTTIELSLLSTNNKVASNFTIAIWKLEVSNLPRLPSL